MSHREQRGFFEAVADANSHLIDRARVLEIGSYDVNGGVRQLFAGAGEYVGVDLTEGPGVDLVSFGHEVNHQASSYDVSLSGECFEHDPHWSKTFENMIRMTRPGGLVAFTCASRGRPEHGTTRALASNSPGTQSKGLDYYGNLTSRDIEAAIPLSERFSLYQFWYLSTNFDLYFAGVRAGKAPPGKHLATLPSSDAVKDLRFVMPATDRLLRIPLRLVVMIVPEDLYQVIASSYLLHLKKVRNGVGSAYRRLVNRKAKPRT